MISIPAAFADRTISREGEAGRRWLASLPSLFEELCAGWELEPDGALMHGGLALALPVRRSGEACVLKVGWAGDATAHEALALGAWDGRGAVRLLATRPEVGALLLERLDSARSLEQVAIERAAEIAGRLLRRLAIPAPPGVPRQQDAATRLAAVIPEQWELLGQPFARRLVDAAVAVAVDLGASADTSRGAPRGLLVNWDLHYGNVLAGTREPWLVIDPKVVAGEPEYGVAQLLWTRLDEMGDRSGLQRVLHILVDAAGLDTERTRRWSIVRCLDYWLWGLNVGLTEDPHRCATVAEWLTADAQHLP